MNIRDNQTRIEEFITIYKTQQEPTANNPDKIFRLNIISQFFHPKLLHLQVIVHIMYYENEYYYLISACELSRYQHKVVYNPPHHVLGLIDIPI